jgi:hypothetical protein
VRKTITVPTLSTNAFIREVVQSCGAIIGFAIAAIIGFGSVVHADGVGGLGGPSSVRADLEPGDGLTDPQFRSTHIQNAFADWFAWKDRLAKEHNFNFSLDYLSLGQWSSSDLGVGSAGGGITRFYGAWAPTPNGSLTFKIENRQAYGAVPPQFSVLIRGHLLLRGRPSTTSVRPSPTSFGRSAPRTGTGRSRWAKSM